MKAIYAFLLCIWLIFSGCSLFTDDFVTEGFAPPSLKNQPRLFYPKAAQELNLTGTTFVIITVANSGLVENVVIEKSSGCEILDNAAIEYSRMLIFNPALGNNIPIRSKVRWAITFKLSEDDTFRERYITDVLELYDDILSAELQERFTIQYNIFELHKDFVSKELDRINFNSTIARVLLPEVLQEWEKDWNSWPLSFLLYHDFIVRFPDFTNLSLIENELKNSLRLDLQFIRSTRADDIIQQKGKEHLLQKIRTFISSNYPKINFDELDTNSEKEFLKLEKNI